MRGKKPTRLSLLVLVVALLIPVAASARPGDLDKTFGTGGKITDPEAYYPRDAVMQADGKLLAVTFSELRRYNKDGSVDTSFGINGNAVKESFTPVTFLDVDVQSDGKIVVAGVTTRPECVGTYACGSEDAFIGRFNPNGYPDLSFGTGGKMVVHSGGAGALTEGRSVKVLSSGKIMVGALTGPSDLRELRIALIRLLANGALDQSFGSGGVVLNNVVPGFEDFPEDISFRSDGASIVLINRGAGDGLLVVKYRPNGSRDAGFGTNGLVTYEQLPNLVSARRVTSTTNGKVLVVGTYYPDNFAPNPAMILRFNTDGSLDGSFGSGGRVLLAMGAGARQTGEEILEQPSGKLVVAASVLTANGNSYDVGLARLNSNGSIDPSFGSGGFVITSFNPNWDDNPSRLLLQSQKLTVVGWTEFVDPPDFEGALALARYLMAEPADCTITGTAGDDMLNGTSGADVICGLAGNDTINGQGGNDILRGDSGNDRIDGGAGKDTLSGGAGTDTLTATDGVSGNDTMDGGSDSDVCVGDSGDVKKNCP